MEEFSDQELRVQVREIVCVLRGRQLSVMHLINPGAEHVVLENCSPQEAWAYVRKCAELFGAAPRRLPPGTSHTPLTPEELAKVLGTSVRYVETHYFPRGRRRRPVTQRARRAGRGPRRLAAMQAAATKELA